MFEPRFIPCGDSFEKIDAIDAEALESMVPGAKLPGENEPADAKNEPEIGQ